MAKYLIKEPAYVGSGMSAIYHSAAYNDQKVITVPNDLIPSRKWFPMDLAAVAALEKIGIKREIGDGEPDQGEEPKGDDSVPKTMHEAQTKPVKRPSDRQ